MLEGVWVLVVCIMLVLVCFSFVWSLLCWMCFVVDLLFGVVNFVWIVWLIFIFWIWVLCYVFEGMSLYVCINFFFFESNCVVVVFCIVIEGKVFVCLCYWVNFWVFSVCEVNCFVFCLFKCVLRFDLLIWIIWSE